MNNEPVAWMMKAREPSLHSPDYITFEKPTRDMKISHHPYALYTHPVKELTDEEIAKVVHELNQKANTPERWVTAMQIGAETIIQLRDELRKAQEK